MNTFRSMSAVVLTFLGGMTAGQALATVSTASLDWGHFDITALGLPNQPTPTTALSNQVTTWKTSATSIADSSDSHDHSASNWTAALDVLSNTPNASGDANISDKLFAASSNALDSNSGVPNTQNTSSAVAHREASLTVSGPAAIVFSIPYSIVMDVPQPDFNHRAAASVAGTATFVPTTGTANITASRSFSFDSLTGPAATQNGNLIFGLVVDGTGVVNFQLDASSSASAPDPVPEPAALLGLIAGLIGLGAALKRGSHAR